MSLIELKAIFSGLVFICGGVCVLLPWVLGRGDRAERLMAWGNAFAGGVLGGAGLVHLLSGGANEFRALAPALEYPLAFVLAEAGFLLILLIEAVIVADHPDPSVSLLHVGSGSPGHEIGPQALIVQPRPVIYLLLLVLSIHSVIVGIALGAQSSVSKALIVFIAVAAHKMMAGFALGISFRRAGATLSRTTPMAGFFSDRRTAMAARTGKAFRIPAPTMSRCRPHAWTTTSARRTCCGFGSGPIPGCRPCGQTLLTRSLTPSRRNPCIPLPPGTRTCSRQLW
jgi:solute carrier family 39 (zinc transporter), member 1/2/3